MFNYDGSIYLGAVKETIIRSKAWIAARFLPKQLRACLGSGNGKTLLLVRNGIWLALAGYFCMNRNIGSADMGELLGGLDNGDDEM